MTDNKQSLDLKDLMSQLNLKDYMGVNPELDQKITELENKRKEDLRNKLRNKTNNMKNNRLGKGFREQNQINALKQTPLFDNIQNNEEMKNAIDRMVSSMAKDSKQKKNIKKQVEKLVEKSKGIEGLGLDKDT